MVIVNRILWIVNILIGIALLLSYLSPYINPMIWWIGAFFGLAFPLLFLLNLIFAVYWLIMGKLKLLFSVACMVLGYSHYAKIYKLSGREANKEAGDIRLVSMNVRYFGQGTDKIYLDSIVDYLKEVKPDIICFQEYAEYPVYKGAATSNSIRRKLGLKYAVKKNSKYGAKDKGTIIYSRFKPIHSGYVSFGEGVINGAIWADFVLEGNDTVRIYSCHLQSNKLSSEYEFHQEDVQNQELAMKKSKSIIKRLKMGFEKRSEQVSLVCDHMNKSPYPVVLAGDMNDTQLSYTYRKMKGNKNDAFVESGSGAGNTYVGPFPSYRIDYIFLDPSLNSYNYKTGGNFGSDHKLIQALIKH